MITDTVRPGDVLVVRTSGVFGWLIRLGQRLQGKPHLDNHVAVVHHIDTSGVIWCIEGRPGGVGWRDAADYLASPFTITNAAQPKTDEQRSGICAAMRQLLNTPYDWRAIADDTEAALRLPDIWRENQTAGPAPGHVVCSSLAVWGYLRERLACPSPTDWCHAEPSDWEAFIQSAPWAPVPAAA